MKGDSINVVLAAAGMNFKRMMNIFKKMFLAFLFYLLKNPFEIIHLKERLILIPNCLLK